MKTREDVGTVKRLALKAGVGEGTIQRVRTATAACGVDTLQAIADVFRLEPWQMLIEGLEPNNPPVLSVAGQREKDFYAKLNELKREYPEIGSKITP